MKILISILLLFTGIAAASQEMAEDASVRQIIEAFFSPFHQQDSTVLRDLTHSSVILQSISTNTKGETKIATESFDNFLKSVIFDPWNHTIWREIAFFWQLG